MGGGVVGERGCDEGVEGCRSVVSQFQNESPCL